MAQAAKSQEPSMEEILASIRRIIAEDDPEKSAQHQAQGAGVELNPDAASSSLGAARAMGDSYSATPARPQDASSASEGFSGAGTKVDRSSTILDLTEPTSSAPRSVASAFDSSSPPPEDAAIEADNANDTASPTQIGPVHDHAGGGLMSSATSAAVDSAFNALAQTVLVHNARTLEDLVREMLRPMLKVWLDDNLPGLVERLVRAEIERVSRGRSG
jgi:uncharacterized protein